MSVKLRQDRVSMINVATEASDELLARSIEYMSDDGSICSPEIICQAAASFHSKTNKVREKDELVDISYDCS